MKEIDFFSFLNQVIGVVTTGHTVRGVLPRFPELIQKHLRLSRVILYYREPDGDAFRPFSQDFPQTELPLLKETAIMFESFTTRRDPLLLNSSTQFYFDLFDRETGDLLKRKGINLAVPLHSRSYYRGLVLGLLGKKEERHSGAITSAIQAAAQICIPLIETERMEMENDRNYYRLFKFDRLVLLGKMAASLAHELRTPLSTVLFEVAGIRSRMARDPEIAAACSKVDQEIARASTMIESLLVFSKFKEMKMEPIRVRGFVAEAIGEIPAKKIPAGVHITVEDDDELIVFSDRDRLKQVLFNILFNALEALDGTGDISIRVFRQHQEIPKNRFSVISIQDNGPGIPDELKEKVLEPFFTTKKEGTGLGLYISYGIMKTLRGDLEIRSSKKGTRVDLILPGERDGK